LAACTSRGVRVVRASCANWRGMASGDRRDWFLPATDVRAAPANASLSESQVSQIGKTRPLWLCVESAVTPAHKVHAWRRIAARSSAAIICASWLLSRGNSDAGKRIGSGVIVCADAAYDSVPAQTSAAARAAPCSFDMAGPHRLSPIILGFAPTHAEKMRSYTSR
jgi:hypothetical protein